MLSLSHVARKQDEIDALTGTAPGNHFWLFKQDVICIEIVASVAQQPATDCTINMKNERTHIYLPAPWPASPGPPAGLLGLPCFPPAQYLGSHSRHWPEAGLKNHTNTVSNHRKQTGIDEMSDSRGLRHLKATTYSSSFWHWGSSAGWWDQTSARTPWRLWRTLLSGCGTWIMHTRL